MKCKYCHQVWVCIWEKKCVSQYISCKVKTWSCSVERLTHFSNATHMFEHFQTRLELFFVLRSSTENKLFVVSSLKGKNHCSIGVPQIDGYIFRGIFSTIFTEVLEKLITTGTVLYTWIIREFCTQQSHRREAFSIIWVNDNFFKYASKNSL